MLEELRPIKWKVNPRKNKADGFKAHSGGSFTSSDSAAARLRFFCSFATKKKRERRIPNIYSLSSQARKASLKVT